jgi:putative hydrolase of the HAD superfamily
MRNDAGVILWDFDGTLAEHPGMWGGCMLEVLDEHEPNHGIAPGSFRPFLAEGFPWHTPHLAHPELGTTEAWWERVEPLLANGYAGVGISDERATTLARLARERYVDVQQWHLFGDVLPVLSHLQKRGWRHLVLSNHVPELGTIVTHLGLDGLFEGIVNSAESGYEKPHPEAFALARRVAGDPPTIWMVGDNPTADVAGAEAAGIPAILVRRDETDGQGVARRAPDLHGVEPFLNAGLDTG